MRAPDDLGQAGRCFMGHYAASLIMVLGTPCWPYPDSAVLERGFHIGIFDPNGRRSCAFPAHVLVLLASGGVHHDSCRAWRDQRKSLPFLRKRVFVYTFMRFPVRDRGFRLWSSGRITVRAGISTYSARSSRCSATRSPYVGGQVFNWTRHHVQGLDHLETPMLYAFGFIGLFTIGGLPACSWRPRSPTSIFRLIPTS